MTNEQMIRELRAVAEKYKGKHVFTCETNINLMATDAANRIESLCDEINRQNAEIERLTAQNGVYETCNARKQEAINSLEKNIDEKNEELDMVYDALADSVETTAVIRADAVKEFAERLKAKAFTNNYWHEVVFVSEIDNLVKEFTEGEKT